MRPFKDLQKTNIQQMKELRVTLNLDEIRERGELLAETNYDQAILEEELKQTSKDYRERIGALRITSARYRDAVRLGTEMRQVPCTYYVDWGIGKRYLVREDTQEEVECDDIPDHWRQGNLDDPWEE